MFPDHPIQSRPAGFLPSLSLSLYPLPFADATGSEGARRASLALVLTRDMCHSLPSGLQGALFFFVPTREEPALPAMYVYEDWEGGVRSRRVKAAWGKRFTRTLARPSRTGM